MVSTLVKIINKYSTLPESLTYFVTNKCNLSCRHCFYWKYLNQNKNELSLAEIDKFSQSLGSVSVLILSGGEPFIRNDFSDLAKILIRNLRPAKLIIASNGSLTEKILNDASQILKDKGKTHITFHFSLDGIGVDHDNFRGMHGLFGKVINTIEQMKKLKNNYDNFDIGVLLTVNPLNQKKVIDIYQYIKNNIRPDVVSPVLMRLESNEISACDIEIGYYEELVKQIKKDTDSGYMKGYSGFPLAKIARKINYFKHRCITQIKKRDSFIMPCFAGVLSGVMYEDGDVSACEILDYSFGNIRNFQYDFKKLWLSQKAKEITNQIKQTKCFCTYECALDVNIAFNLKNLIMAIIGR